MHTLLYTIPGLYLGALMPGRARTQRGAAGEAAKGDAAGAGTSQDIDVRHCETAADFAACVRLQKLTWGEGYRDVVTASLLKVSRRVGGVVAAAFLETGEAAGFVFGLTGVNGGGRPTHWSHMLAVAPAYRDRGVGRRLKRFQWDALRAMGVETAQWTFDPLVARNAHLNVNRLGVEFEEYVPDMYADTGSGLHAFGTDRFVVSWRIDDRVGPGAGRIPARPEAPVVNVDSGGTPLCVPRDVSEPAVRIEIPADIEALLARDIEALREWRTSTRAAFLRYLAKGLRVTGFVRGVDAGWYVLESESGAG